MAAIIWLYLLLIKHMQIWLICLALIGLGACVPRETHSPMDLSFTDGSKGECIITNRKMAIKAQVPSNVLIHRSDDDLVLDCVTVDGRKGSTSVPSRIEDTFETLIWEAMENDGTDQTLMEQQEWDRFRIYPDKWSIPVLPVEYNQ